MHGPIRIVWANLTLFSLQWESGTVCRVNGAGQQTQTAVADDGVPPQQLHLGADGMAELDPNLSIHAGHGPDALLQVRKTPSWPRSWANFSPLSLYPHRNAWANVHLLGQPNHIFAGRYNPARTYVAIVVSDGDNMQIDQCRINDVQLSGIGWRSD